MSIFLRLSKPARVFFASNVKCVIHRCFNDISFEDIPEVSPTIIKKVLKSFSISFEEGFTCFKVSCPLCKKTKTAQSNVYINKETGMFMCSSCKCSGQWDSFRGRLKTDGKGKRKTNEIDVKEVEKLKAALDKIHGETSKITENNLGPVLANFKLPGIPYACLESIDVRVDKLLRNLYFPLENAECEIVGYRKVNRHTKRDETIPDLSYGGLLTARLGRHNVAVLVPTIADFLVLVREKIMGNVVCLPNGLQNLSQCVLPSLERFKTLVLWFGNDVKSWDCAKQFAKKLGEKRCLFIRPNEKHLLPHLAQGEDVKEIIGTAQPIWHKSITTFATLRQDVLTDLQNVDKVEGVKWKRYPSLNKTLKGHRRGELTVVTGPTGSGKTTFISDYSLDLAMQGVNTLWGSFEIRNARLARTMLQQMAGMPLEENLCRFDKWADQFEELPIYFMTFHGQQTIKVVMEAVEHATYVHDIAHVIIDNLQFMMGMTDDTRHMDRFWKQDAIIAAFRSFCTRKNCHVTLVIHPRKEREDLELTASSIFGGAKASQEADNVLIIQDKRLTSIKGKKYLQVVKNRYSGDLGVMPLDFNKSSLSYAPKKSKKVEQDKAREKKTDESG